MRRYRYPHSFGEVIDDVKQEVTQALQLAIENLKNAYLDRAKAQATYDLNAYRIRNIEDEARAYLTDLYKTKGNDYTYFTDFIGSKFHPQYRPQERVFVTFSDPYHPYVFSTVVSPLAASIEQFWPQVKTQSNAYAHILKEMTDVNNYRGRVSSEIDSRAGISPGQYHSVVYGSSEISKLGDYAQRLSDLIEPVYSSLQKYNELSQVYKNREQQVKEQLDRARAYYADLPSFELILERIKLGQDPLKGEVKPPEPELPDAVALEEATPQPQVEPTKKSNIGLILGAAVAAFTLFKGE